MASSKALLAIFLISLANEPEVTDGKTDHLQTAMSVGKSDEIPMTVGKSDEIPISVGKNDEIPMTVGKSDEIPISVGKNDEIPMTVGKSDEIPMTVGKSDEIPMTVGKGFQMQNMGAFGLSINIDGDRVTIANDYIRDTFAGMTSTSPNVVHGIVMIGDRNQMIYNDKRDAVVQIKGNTCYRITYKIQERINNQVLDSSECAEISEKVFRKSGSSATVVNVQRPAYQQNMGGSHYGNSDYSFSKPKPNVSNFFSSRPSYQQSSGNQWSTGNHNIIGTGNNKPFGNSWPFGSNNGNLGSNNGNLGSNNGNLGSNNGNNENSGRHKRRTSKRRVSGQPDAVISWISS